MPQFKYKARNKEGESVSGTKEAKDKYELARMLRRDGFLLLSAEGDGAEVDDAGAGLFKKDINIEWLKKLQRVKLQDKIVFSKNLGVMIGAGLPITRAIDALGRESENQKFQDALTNISEQIRKGRAFSEALQDHPKIFPPLYVAMVEAGEKSGKLKESLEVLAHQMQADYDLIRKVRGAMIYPGVIITAMIGIGVLMMVYVVPTLSAVFNDLNVELPASTRFVIGASEALQNYGILIGAFIAICGAGLWRLQKTKQGKNFIDLMFLKIPIVGPLAKKFNSARTARTLSSLVSAGVSVLEALDITSRVVQNHFYSDILIEAKAQVQQGETISKVFLAHKDHYPSLMSEMLSVGEETGESSKMLSEVADFYETQVADTTKDLSTIIEPVLMIIIGVAVGFFAVSMLTPMYSLTDAL